MSLLDEMMSESAVPAHLDLMGDTVLYRPVNGSGRDIAAVISRKNETINNEQSHQSVQTVLMVTTSYDSNGLTDLSIGDVIGLYGSNGRLTNESWCFRSVKEVSGGFITATFTKTDITQRGKKPSNL